MSNKTKIEIDIYQGIVKEDGKRVDLSMKEYRLILLLISDKSGATTKEIMGSIYPNSIKLTPQAVYTLIERTNAHFSRNIIKARFGKYRLVGVDVA